ncbi:MAG: HAD-IB family phosphatase, partial [Chloroflexota bacterium]
KSEFNRFYYPNLPKGFAYNMGWVRDEQAFREEWIQKIYGMFGNFTPREFDDVANWVVEEELWPKRKNAVVAELVEHIAEGRRVILISGLVEPILSKFAKKIGAESIGTRMEMFDGKLTGKLILPFTTVHEKVNQIRHLLPDGKVFAAYGDSGADIHMLKLAENASAVTPDKELEEHAQAADWRIIL